jgi:hypothetical protein
VVPVVRSLDLVKVTLRVNGGPVIVRWEPRVIAEARLRAVSAFIAGMGRSQGFQENGSNSQLEARRSVFEYQR